jgi:uncharacterized protein (TIGR02594 family)
MTGVELFESAQRYVGIRELGTRGEHPLIQWWLSLCGFGFDAEDEVPWCSAFVNGIAWQHRLPRSKSAAARSWLGVGFPVATPMIGDIVVLKRGADPQPGPEVLQAPGHVGIYAGQKQLLGGNQGDGVSIMPFDDRKVLGYRRITE